MAAVESVQREAGSDRAAREYPVGLPRATRARRCGERGWLAIEDDGASAEIHGVRAAHLSMAYGDARPAASPQSARERS